MILRMWEVVWKEDKYPPIVAIVLWIMLAIVTVLLVPISLCMWLVGYKPCYYCCKSIAYWHDYTTVYIGGGFEDGPTEYRCHKSCKGNR